MNSFLSLLLAGLLLVSPCSAQTFDWVRTFGSGNIDYAYNVTTDANGNVLSSGNFSGTVDFDPGPGNSNLISNGGQDVFIQKMDANGNFIWAKSIGSTDNDWSTQIKTDAAGNVYVLCGFKNQMDADPGVGVHILSAGNATYKGLCIIKLDANGNFVSAIQRFSPQPNKPYISSMDFDMDNSGNIYMTYGFGGGGFDFTLTTVEKINSSGNTVWSTQIQSSPANPAYIISQIITLSPSGDIIVGGLFSGDVDFSPTNPHILSTLSINTYILKLTNAGSFVFVEQLGGGVADVSYLGDITADANNNIIIAGNYSGTIDFDPGAGVQNLTAVSSGNSMYMLKLTSAGAYLWVNSYGTIGDNYFCGVTTDVAGNIYSTGSFAGTCDFSVPSVTLNSAGSRDAFVLKVNPQGNYSWVKQFGGSGATAVWGYDISVGTNDIYTCGEFNYTADFNYNNPNSYKVTANGWSDGFVHKMGICPAIDTSVSQSSAIMTANETGGTYQWIDCSNNQAIPNATAKTFTATANGNYAVVITKGSCSDTSLCHTVSGLSVNDITHTTTSIYPNPTNGQVHIVFNKTYDNIEVIITSAIGQTIAKNEYHHTKAIDLELQGPAGIYNITIKSDGIIDHNTISKIY